MDLRTARSIAAAALAVALAAPAIPAGGAPASAPGRHVPTGRVVMRFDPAATSGVRTRALERAGVRSDRLAQRRRGLAVVTPAPGETPAEAARRLSAQAGVLFAAPEGRVRALGAEVPPDDPNYAGGAGQEVYLGPVASHTYSVNLEPAWNRAFNDTSHTLVEGRAGAKMAIIDSGVSVPYIESTGEFVPVWDFVGGDTDTSDLNGHGTRVASILRAKTANGKGIAGALHSSTNQVLVYRVLDAGGYGDTADFLDAIYDAADRGARVINCSLGESLYDGSGLEVTGLRASYEDAVAYAYARGAIIVAASGNAGSLPPPDYFTYAPACVDEAVGVASIDPVGGGLSSFSNYGPANEIDVVAVGEDVWGLAASGTAYAGDGTSYATPIVAGSLALLMSTAPAASPATAVDALLRSGSSWPVKNVATGYGVPDIDAAYSALTTGLPEQGAVAVTAGAPSARTVTLSWGAASGTGVTYEYGEVGGPTYATTARSASVVLSAEGTRTLWVRSYATDRWSHQATLALDVAVPADGRGPLTAKRLEGSTRYRTAVGVSRDSFPSSAPAVLIASGQDWPDALAAAPLAAVVGGPLLLTDPSSLTIETRDEIWRLGPSRIFIAGGTGAVSATVRNQLDSLAAGDTVTRFSGIDRYETARLVAAQIASEQGGSIPGGRAFICSGATYADALSGAAPAAAAGQPVLLTPPSAISPQTSQAISTLGITDTVVLGGTGAVSNSVLASLPSPTRVWGADRYATSRAVADWAVLDGTLTYASFGFARGDTFPDALAAGGRMGAEPGPLVLVPTSASASLDSWLAARGPEVDEVAVFGGSGAVGYGLENDLRVALRSW